MKDLVIVEASGKTEALKAKLKAIGIRAEVIPTLGHIADNPESINDIALDRDLHETRYQIKSNREALIEKILREAVKADNIYLAMDDDQEGNVIAYDLAQRLGDCGGAVKRVRLRALSESELRTAFNQASGADLKTPAHNGICRRIVDRAIGSAYTVVENHTAIPVGRVQSSLLATLDKHLPQMGHFILEAKFNAGVFRADVPVYTKQDIEELTRIQAIISTAKDVRQLGAVDVTVPVSQPWGYEEIVAETSLRFSVPVDQAADALQEAYERGKVSYPRIRKNGYTPDAVELVAALANHNRCQFSGELLPMRSGGISGMLPHESPRPVDDEMLLGRPMALLDLPEAVAVLVARNVIECGQTVDMKKVRLAVAERELEFCYMAKPPRRNWKAPEVQRGYHAFSLGVALLRYMSLHDLGRPSTVVPHVTKFLQRDLIQSNGSSLGLNAKGRRWLEHACAVGFDEKTSSRIEEALSGVVPDPHATARSILDQHGMLEGVMKKIFDENPQKSLINDAELSF